MPRFLTGVKTKIVNKCYQCRKLSTFEQPPEKSRRCCVLDNFLFHVYKGNFADLGPFYSDQALL